MVELTEAKKVIEIFGEMEGRLEEIKDIRADQKEMLEMFCEQNPDYTPKQLKAGYKYFIKFIKDRSQLTEDELERDKIIEIIENV